MRLLKDFYGALILFFYYFKIPFIIVLPTLYFYLDYSNNFILDILYLISIILLIKDIILFYKKVKLYGSIKEALRCDNIRCKN